MTIPKHQSRHHSGRQSGLTLIELVVVMAVFALVAVMGVQALSAMLIQRDALSARAQNERDLLYATGLLRRDLGQALPLLFSPPDEAPPPRSALAERTTAEAGFSLSTAVPRPNGQPPGGLGGRVAWWVDPDSAQLMRQGWPTLWPVSADQAGPAVVVLDGGVDGLELRSYWSGVGWINGLRLDTQDTSPPEAANSDGDQLAAAPESYSDQLPLAIELHLKTRASGDLLLVEVLP